LYRDFCSSTVFAARISDVLLNALRAPWRLWTDLMAARARVAERHCALGTWDSIRDEKADSSDLLGINGFDIVATYAVLRNSLRETLTSTLSLDGGQVQL
jgi:hypothetical protein